ncbi:MAG: M56 family metallopeptidase [Clostridia bacterium]
MNVFLEEFLEILIDLSTMGSFAIVFVLIARVLLKKVEKIYSYALWLVVLFRLLCPFSFESEVAVLPSQTQVQPTFVSDGVFESTALKLPYSTEVFEQSTPIETASVAIPMSFILMLIWFLGFISMFLYSVIALLKTKKNLVGCMLLKDNIFLADHIKTPFVMGFLKPKIYLPSTINATEIEFIVMHEKTHIKRFDHITRILAFVALCVHWFNPLVWLAFVLSAKDMEMSCDEAVMNKMGDSIKKEYSSSLLRFEIQKHLVSPLAFSEGDTKGRVKNIMKHRKTKVWVSVLCVVLVSTFAFMLIGNKSSDAIVFSADYSVDEVIYNTNNTNFENYMYSISENYSLYVNQDGFWKNLGSLQPYSLSNDELDGYLKAKSAFVSSKSLKEITDSYILTLPNEDNMFYIVMQTKSDETYLGYGWEDVFERSDSYSDDTKLQWLIKLESLEVRLEIDEPVEIYAYSEKQSILTKITGYTTNGTIDNRLNYTEIDYNDVISFYGDEMKNETIKLDFSSLENGFDKIGKWNDEAKVISVKQYFNGEEKVFSNYDTNILELSFEKYGNYYYEVVVDYGGTNFGNYAFQVENLAEKNILAFHVAGENATEIHVTNELYEELMFEIQISSIILPIDLQPSDITQNYFYISQRLSSGIGDVMLFIDYDGKPWAFRLDEQGITPISIEMYERFEKLLEESKDLFS